MTAVDNCRTGSFGKTRIPLAHPHDLQFDRITHHLCGRAPPSSSSQSVATMPPPFVMVQITDDWTILGPTSPLCDELHIATKPCRFMSRYINSWSFTKGLLVYGREGREIFRRNLDVSICREALVYSHNHKIPIIAFSEDRCLTLFEHPLVEALHTVYHEPKAEIIPSVEQLLADKEIQKLIFLDSSEGVAGTLRPYWEEATQARASVVQAVPDMLEIVPPGTSKGNGVRILLDHLGVPPNEIMAIGDGENDVEMLELASLGVVLSNGSEKAKAVANENTRS
ncbi:haloacid dehalogenase-like hydrolase family protein [Striga hermonthica]|uniref:Haloacid dehalogenase-like hydrolase family protein n=1 Tax=Striga hermonthica TaxID=68872 RepID=A0A9N7MGL7_STRHE|nr:haloacid dehalogenase-like hydrolase family protein [Striga hermonthica]